MAVCEYLFMKEYYRKTKSVRESKQKREKLETRGLISISIDVANVQLPMQFSTEKTNKTKLKQFNGTAISTHTWFAMYFSL